MNQDIISGSQNKLSVFKALKEIPEELLWKANFNSDNSILTIPF